MKRMVLFVLTIGLLGEWSVPSASAAPPTVIVSLRSIDELIDDFDFVCDAIGQKGMKGIAELGIGAVTNGEGLSGIDRTQPLGGYWSIANGAPGDMGAFVAFVPISDAVAFEKLIKKLVPGVTKVSKRWSLEIAGLPPLVATMKENYFFVSTSESELKGLADPKKIANKAYDIAIDINLSTIPQPLKDIFLETTEREGRKSMENDAKIDNKLELLGQQIGFDSSLAALKSVTNDGDRFTLGLDVNTQAGLVSFDVSLTAQVNSALAKGFGVFGKSVPVFGAVPAETAPFRLVMCVPTSGLIDRADELFEAMRESADAELDNDEKLNDEADKKAAKDIAKRLFNIAQATLKSGSLQSVVVLEQGDDDTVRLIGGSKLAKGDDAGKLLDDVLKLSKESPDVANVTPDVAKHAGARIHAIEDVQDQQAEMFGNSPFHLAIREDSIWFSFGGGNLDALKKALDLSAKKPSKTGAPISLRVMPATMVTLMESKDTGLIERAEAIAGEPGDILIVEIAPTTGAGVKLHIEFGLDLFKLADLPENE